MRRAVGVGCLASIVVACGFRPFPRKPPDEPARHSRLGLAISGMRVSNGLRIVLVPDPNATEVQVTLRYHAGAVDDPVGQEGMAHLAEHLMFQQVLNGQSLFAKLQDATSYFNGSTTFDVTTFVERGPASQLENLLTIEAARLKIPCTTIGDDVFRREREVVINEISQRSTSFQILDALDQAFYPAGHPYHRASTGTATSLRSISLADACAFATSHYGLGNAVLVVSGKVSEAGLDAALHAILPGIPARAVAPATAVPPVVATAGRFVETAPIRERAVVLAWALPADPERRAIVRAMASVVAERAQLARREGVALMELGGERAPLLVMAMAGVPDDALDALGNGLAQLRGRDAERRFEAARQRALHALFAKFEDGATRDVLLAQHVEAGREGGEGFAGEVRAISEVTYPHARDIAEHELAMDRAVVIDVRPSAPHVGGGLDSLDAPIHDAGQPRLETDPREAHRPSRSAGEPDPLAGMRTRKLANGLTVILLPLSSVPTVEARLVFATGISDEPADKRGLARLAAFGLQLAPQPMDRAWLLPFYQAGGGVRIDVGLDRTTFAVSGIDMYLDYLLTGLARSFQKASYRDVADQLPAVAAVAKRIGRDPVATSWSEALFGRAHPYAHAGLGEIDVRSLDAASIQRFHDEHLCPDDATLVVAGGFDAATADAWIDFLFDDWRGHSIPHTATPTALQALSIGHVEPGPQLGLEIALPVLRSGGRATQLVAAEMIQELVDGVRHELGASYGIDVELSEARLGAHYALSGHVDAARAAEAAALIRDRLARLHASDDALAEIFVSARARVLGRLQSFEPGSIALANRVERAISLQRDLRVDEATATAVRALTIDGMASTLADIDLARGAILVRGSRAGLDAVFAAFGRTPAIASP